MLKYINIFLEETSQQINLLEKAIDLKEWSTTESIAHALKSQLNFIGAKSIALIAGKIKEAAGTESERNLLPIQLRELKIQFQSACDELINVHDNLMANG